MKAKPRLGFLGLGWIGLHRMQAVTASGIADVTAIADVSAEALQKAAEIHPAAHCCRTLDQLLTHDLDGVVIATPSALHAEQAIAALDRKIAVFCQKPLGRNAAEVSQMIESARRSDVLLGVDLSYRFTNGIRAIRDAVQSHELGQIYAADLVFHNAYGPDKKWFYDPKLSGGGCLIDLGTHLVDLALWMVQSPVTEVTGRLFAKGMPLASAPHPAIEDYATAQIHFASGATARIACSWNLNAGCDALIEATFYGNQGGASFKNVNGSFYDFHAALFHGTSSQVLSEPPEEWGPRALLDWSCRLASGARFDSAIREAVEVARILDSIYRAAQ